MDITSTYHIIRASSEHELKPITIQLTDSDLIRGALLELEHSGPHLFELNASENWTPPHFIGHRFPVVSNRFVDLLTSMGVSNIELYPVIIRNAHTKVEWDGYSLFNVIGLLNAADLESSVGEVLFENEKGVDWIAFDELVLSRNRTHNFNLFRLANNPEILLIHGSVLSMLIEKAPFNGWGFTSMEVELR